MDDTGGVVNINDEHVRIWLKHKKGIHFDCRALLLRYGESSKFVFGLVTQNYALFFRSTLGLVTHSKVYGICSMYNVYNEDDKSIFVSAEAQIKLNICQFERQFSTKCLTIDSILCSFFGFSFSIFHNKTARHPILQDIVH